MAQNDQRNSSIDYINIDCGSNYFNTREQILLREQTYFIDASIPSKLTGSNTVVGLFSQPKIKKDAQVYNSPIYVTSSVVVDPSGAPRSILSPTNDYISSGSTDRYKNGVEISQEQHWTAGMVKISAGTAGHLHATTLFGVNESYIISKDAFVEVNIFNPVDYVSSGSLTGSVTYVAISTDSKEQNLYSFNGVIEPLDIRPVASRLSTFAPFDPHAIRGQYGNGNINPFFASEEILTVDYFLPKHVERAFFLDAGGAILLGASSIQTPRIPTAAYVNTDQNVAQPFEDITYPRGESFSTSYGLDLIEALRSFLPGGTTYVSQKQKASTSGFVYDNTPQGTDSITYGGLLY